jgi:hypothetical protein
MEIEKRSSRFTLIAFCILAAVAAFYLLTEHRAHVLGAWPFLIFLLCPLMHLFMHRGHSHQHGENTQRKAPTPTKDNQDSH